MTETDCEPDRDTPPVQRTISEWMSNRDARGDVLGAEPATDPSQNPEKLGYGSVWVRVKVQRQDGSTKQVDTPHVRMRFDSATYLTSNGRTGAIFPDVNPVMNFPINTPEFAAMRESGLHYLEAMEHPEQTIPTITGKPIPGAIGGTPLHRLYHDNYWREKNREEAMRTCVSDLPPGQYPREGYDCDEYPSPARARVRGRRPIPSGTSPSRRFPGRTTAPRGPGSAPGTRTTASSTVTTSTSA